MNTAVQGWGVWLALSAACLGTYACRALGVKLSGHIHQESEIFRWVAAVTYAMVAALTVRMLLMPLGLLATVPMVLRMLICVVSLAVMVSRPSRRMAPAPLIGTLLMLSYGVVRTA
jgi:hypothetical protein